MAWLGETGLGVALRGKARAVNSGKHLATGAFRWQHHAAGQCNAEPGEARPGWPLQGLTTASSIACGVWRCGKHHAWQGRTLLGAPGQSMALQGPKTVEKGDQRWSLFSLGKRLTTFAILATGASMSQAVADSVRGRCSVVAVSDCFKLAPWADALVSQDRAWWTANPDAMEFKGRKFAGVVVPEVEKFPSVTGSNSGLVACQVAVEVLGAKRILLLGVDLRGGHYFGPHPAPLRNTAPHRFEAFQDQFKRYQPRGVEIINCTPSSALKAYRKASLNDCLP